MSAAVAQRSVSLRAISLPALTVLMAAVLVWSAFSTPGFFTLGNAQAILTSTIFVGMVAVGMTLVMVSGSFVSLALATTATISAMVFMACLSWGVLPAIVVTLVLALATGAAQGVVIGGWNANPIIVTIAAAAIMEGLAVALSQGVTINPVGLDYRMLNARYFGLPLGVYVLAALVVGVEAIMRLTAFGRMVYLVGDNRTAARAAALPLGPVGAGVFAIAGACAGLAGIFMASFNHSASLLLSRGTLGYDAIAAVLIGGAAIGGGRGTVLRSMLGVVVIAVVTDLVLLRGFSTGAQIALKGMVMVAFALAVHLRQEMRG
jgi:ribose/xylose/arabinose/galactoside ABC-type transport system permease subunit